MLQRLVAGLLARRLAAYPAVALTGPRQCGKTTLAQRLGGHYYDLEQEAERLRLDLDWDRVTAGRTLLVLDEAQAWPEVFPRIRAAIDQARRRRGRFLLLGSVSPGLMTRVAESLAGRLGLIELTPLLAAELTSRAARARHWLCGGFPDGGVLGPAAFPRWQLDYLALLAQRDLPLWGLAAGPQTTDRLLRMLAVLNGQQWNASQLGQSLGLSYHTVNSYLDHLVGAYLVRRLPAWHANLRKRLVRSPRVYWRDTGLLHALQGVGDRRALLSQPWVGASWEGHVIEQVLGTLAALGRDVTPYYFRTSDGYELDLVLEFGRERWAIEVKLTTAPGPGDLARLDRAADLIKASRRFLVSQIARSDDDGERFSCDLPTMLGYLRSA